jgi:AraC family transcriptional regulator of adaptative response / DNA-3-methyladenine glycosylase II
MGAVTLDPDTCYRALAARDPRFDGLFFVGVRTTGVYCRPVCPARTPGRDRVVFFARGAEAEHEGYRACFRCRPELAPGRASVDATTRLADLAWARVEAGFLNEGSVDELAHELGVTPRHLSRVLRAALGVSPVQLAQSRRLALAKQLLQDTSLPLTQVAFAAGFGSVRRFNALFQRRFGRPPSSLRRAHGEAATGAGLSLRLDYRPPLDWRAMLDFLRPRCIPGVERVEGDSYARTVILGVHRGTVVVRPDPHHPALRAEASTSLAPVTLPLVARLRALFDLDAQPAEVDGALSRDRELRPLIRARPGVRLPGAFDGFEVAVRVILGQQVTVKGASTLAGRLARAVGEVLETGEAGLDRAMPRAAVLAATEPGTLARAVGLPLARATAVTSLARAVSAGGLRLDRHAPVEATLARLRELPGFGDWTTQVVALRALGWPDAFPAGDLALRQRLGAGSVRELVARADSWRPWRAYATVRLWLTEGGE